MLGRQDPQMDLADAVLWTGKIEPKPLVEKGTCCSYTWRSRARQPGAVCPATWSLACPSSSVSPLRERGDSDLQLGAMFNETEIGVGYGT